MEYLFQTNRLWCKKVRLLLRAPIETSGLLADPTRPWILGQPSTNAVESACADDHIYLWHRSAKGPFSGMPAPNNLFNSFLTCSHYFYIFCVTRTGASGHAMSVNTLLILRDRAVELPKIRRVRKHK